LARIISTSLVKAEGAGPRDVARVGARAHVELHTLAGGVHRRVVEINFKTELVAFVRRQARPLGVGALAFAHFHRLDHADKALGCGLQFNARRLQQKHKRRSRAVQDGHFFGRDIDIQVVDAQARASRHQMLNGMHLGAAARNRRRQPRVRHRLRRDHDIHRLRQIHPPKHNPRVRRRRPQSQLHPLPTVQAHAHGFGQ
jgi:hypothetical protein